MNSAPDPNEPFDSLSRELASFRPATPSSALKQRIRNTVQTSTSPPLEPGVADGSGLSRARTLAIWAGIAAAVVISGSLFAVRMAVQPTRAEEPEIATAVSGEEAEVVVAEIEEETLWFDGELTSIVDTGEGPPMWKVRCETVRRTAWSDGQGATQIRFEPEERLLFIPVSYN